MKARRLFGVVATAICASLLAFASPAHADLTLYTPWSSVLPGWNDQYVPSSDNDCAAGKPHCLSVTLGEQTRILNSTGPACSHLAIFPLAYVRMTQTYGWTRSQAGYYNDVPYMNHMDAVFAKYYTDAYYNWTNGTGSVPSAWQIAFTAAKNKTVTGAGDLFLGMNAHINRDLPFVLYASGLVESDGVTSGKADYDAVEQWLNDDTAPLLSEAAQRFDPTIDDTNNPLIDYTAFQMVSAWRENAWRQAELLAAAPTAAARAIVAQSIENYATTTAQAMLLSFAVNPLVETNAARDAYCALHNGDTTPVTYPMGTPTPYGNTVN